MKSHRQSFLWKAFCLYSPFSSLMNQWVFRSLSPIDLQHEMCLVVFRNHQQERVSFVLLHVSASQKILSFSFCRKISPSFRPLPVNDSDRSCSFCIHSDFDRLNVARQSYPIMRFTNKSLQVSLNAVSLVICGPESCIKTS